MTPVSAGQALALRDIQVPPAPGLWPPAPGWWVLLALVAITLGLGLWWISRRLRLLRRRRRILEELARLGDRAAGPELAAEVSALLKRVALTRFPRAQVAPLTGTSWLELLDRSGGEGCFSAGVGRVLAEGPYAPASAFDADALLALARDWIKKNT
jgi:hypothetical protein